MGNIANLKNWIGYQECSKQYLRFTTKIIVGTLSIVTTIMILFQCLAYSAERNYTELNINRLYVKMHILAKNKKYIYLI